MLTILGGQDQLLVPDLSLLKWDKPDPHWLSTFFNVQTHVDRGMEVWPATFLIAQAPQRPIHQGQDSTSDNLDFGLQIAVQHMT